MTIFCGFKHIGLVRETTGRRVTAVALSIVFVCLFSAGCKRHAKPVLANTPSQAPIENVFTNRANNAAYMESLKQTHRVQVSKAIALRNAVTEMKAYREQVKTTLASGTNEAALAETLAKDATWLKLKAQVEQARQDDKQAVLAAREQVRQALNEEERARKAVAEGKARAIDQVKTK